ncbi:MAG TPA: PKD domain-containing protein, partial [Bacteroidia bacterium]
MRKIYILSVVLFTFFFFLSVSSFAQVNQSESFDGATFPPTGWTRSGSYPGSMSTQTVGANPAQTPHSGANELMWNSYSVNCYGCTEDLITPMFDLSGRSGNSATVSFWFYRDNNAAYNSNVVGPPARNYLNEGVNVYINTSSSITGATNLGFVARAIAGTPVVGAAGWYQYTFNIPAGFNTCSNYLIFDFVSWFGDNCFMDDVQFTTYPSSPVLNFTAAPTTTCSGKTVTFTNYSTNTCYVDHYTYNFGEGTPLTVYNSNPVTHTYINSGYWYPTVTAYDAAGNNLGSYSFSYINVQYVPTTFYMSKDSACPGEQISFNSSYSPSSWKISNGYTTSAYSFQRSFTAGTYTVGLYFNSPCGPDSILQVLQIKNTIYPNASFTKSLDSSCKNYNIYFNPTDYSGTHSWNFGDGKSSTLPNPSHQYTATGTYTVSHSV